MRQGVRFQCPYHAWIYDLDGSLIRAKHTDDLDDFSFETFGLVGIRVETWQGFVFVNLDTDAEPLGEWLGDLVPHLDRFDFGALRVAHTETYEVDANWKFLAENYSECYHCPGIHPQLNKLTPYDLGGDFSPEGPWQGGWMELVGDAETMALDGGHRAGRPAMAGITELDDRRVYYYLIWPSTFISIHPDYVLVHRLVPAAAGHTRIVCDWLFEPSTIAAPDFDPSDAIGFWVPDQSPGLARLRAPAAGHALAVMGRRSVLEPGAERPRVRPDVCRPVRGRRRRLAGGPCARATTCHRPRTTRRASATARATSRRSCLPRSAGSARAGARARARG